MDWKRDDELKKIFIPARHGLGDQIASFFLPIQYKKPNPNVNILKRVKYGLKHGLLDEAMVIYEEGYNPCGWQLYAYLDFIISTKRTYCFADVPDQANNNWMPDKISSGHINVMTCPPTEFLQLPTTEIVEPAERRPPFSIPSNDYILFNDSAAGQDRRLTNHQIYKDLRVLGMPIVRVGAGYAAGYGNCSATECDLDLVDKTTIPEIFWLARHAKLIVSALSFYRVFTSFYKVPVIEIAQMGNVNGETMDRTRAEYQVGSYGINELNQWCEYPSTQFNKILGEMK